MVDIRNTTVIVILNETKWSEESKNQHVYWILRYAQNDYFVNLKS
ncbi:MAG: hypothetical protein ABSG15_10140 [FCB group bacterium]